MTTSPDVHPRRHLVEGEGLRVVALDWGGDGPPLLFLHANGFCGGAFEPLCALLRSRSRPITIDLRGHGGSDRPELDACSWSLMAHDVLAVLDRLELPDVLVVGHSLGGSVAMILDELHAGVVERALLCEAVAVDEAHASGIGQVAQRQAERARRRRAVWPDRDEARASYAGRPPLSSFAPESLDAYLRWGFHDRPDGQVELACEPEVEAAVFEAGAATDGAPRAFAHLPAMAGRATIVRGDATELPAAMFEAQARCLSTTALVVAGTHFFVYEDVAALAALVDRALLD